MESGTIVVWLLRLVSIALVLAPQAYYYSTSTSPIEFFAPSLASSSLDLFDPSSLRVTLVDYSVTGENTCSVRVRVLNTGSVRFGLKDANVRMHAPSPEFSGRVAIQPFTVDPGEEELVSATLTLERGTCERLPDFFSKSSANFSGEATLIIGPSEVPLNFSVDLRLGG